MCARIMPGGSIDSITLRINFGKGFKKHRQMVAPGRVELPTFGLGNRCSIHLSYGANAT